MYYDKVLSAKEVANLSRMKFIFAFTSLLKTFYFEMSNFSGVEYKEG